MLSAARRAGVPRVVHTSSVAAIGVRADGEPANEEVSERAARIWSAPTSARSTTPRSWCRARCAGGQDVVHRQPDDAGRALGCEADADRRDRRALLHRARCRRTWTRGSTSSTCATSRPGTSAAFERGRTGERYILGNENMTLRGLLERLAATHRPAARADGPPAARGPLPTRRSASSCSGRWASSRTSVRGRPDGQSSECTMTRRKRTANLGLRPAPVTRALADAVTWFTRARLSQSRSNFGRT